ncbi:hypothetical protein K1U26_002610, partial [Escherichia coli]|nr:hypothetical protein [Escherichia coli]
PVHLLKLLWLLPLPENTPATSVKKYKNHHRPDLDDDASTHPTKQPNLLISKVEKICFMPLARTRPQKEKARAGDARAFGYR